MRYVKQEHIITTICVEDVDDLEVIQDLLETLQIKQIYFSISYNKEDHNGYNTLLNHKNVRIKKIHDGKIDFGIYDHYNVVKIKNISFEDIEKIHIITKKSNILKNKGKNKFGLLKLDTDEE